MKDKWIDVAIGDIAEIVGGSTPPTADKSNFDGDIPWLTPKDLSGAHGRYVSHGERNLSDKGLACCSARLLPLNSVLLSSRAPIGYVAIAANQITTNQGFRSLVLKPGYDHEFLYYWLSANIEELERHASGSTFKELSGSSLKNIRIRIPSDLTEQCAIAHILGTLDDKIELNRRMNKTLEARAQALFKSWFVDFDPVRAKIECRWKRGQYLPGLPAHLWDLFPDCLVDSELGEIPKGWGISTVGEEFILTMGQSPPGETYNEIGEGIPFFQGRADFEFRYPSRRVFCPAATRFADPGDTLVSVRAPVGDINMALERCAVGRGVAAIRHKSGSRSYTYHVMLSLVDVFGNFEADGTVFGCINKDDFHRIKSIAPPLHLVLDFEKAAFPIDQTIENNIVQSRTLAALRDALLPKLIFGEIRTKDVKEFMGGIV